MFGISFYKGNKHSFIEKLYFHLRHNEKKFVVTANPEIIMNANQNAAYKDTVTSADYVVADGIGVVKALSLYKRPVAERITGIDVMLDLLEMAVEENLGVYFLGAENSSLNKMVENISTMHPNLQIAGFHHGYFHDSKEISLDIQAKQPDLVFIALGSPYQETWIGNHIGQFEKGVFIGVGGSFDILSGKYKRSPKLLRNLNLEWLYRVCTHPRGIRKIRTLLLYTILVLKEYVNLSLTEEADVKEES